MTGVAAVVLALLIGSGVMVLIRLARGPSMLDRAVAVDALLAVVVAGLGAQAAEDRTPYTLPVLLVLAFLGFTGSVAVARFIAVRGPEPGAGPEAGPGTGPGTDRPDADPPGTGPPDADRPGAGPTGAGPDDAGPTDAGPDDAGPTNAGPDDAGPTNAGPDDAGPTGADDVAGNGRREGGGG